MKKRGIILKRIQSLGLLMENSEYRRQNKSNPPKADKYQKLKIKMTM
jgi:hypothetical protein